ncbi:MAG: hypothetical protein FWD31_08940, partial [Planctomycetaceae bacterium]|nr:hypothetical protein [Planctomycetaceae bacterium]
MLKNLTSLLLADDRFVACKDALRDGKTVVLDRIWGSSCALAVAALTTEALTTELSGRGTGQHGTMIVVLKNQDEAERTADDLALFTDLSVATFPALDDIEMPLRVSDEQFGDRIRILKMLAGDTQRRDSIIVTSIAALLQPVPPIEMLRERTRHLKVGGTLDQKELARWLVDGQYHATSGVELPGEYAIRGSIVDIFAPDWDMPVRVEFFGDEIESIRRFEVAGQRSLETLNEIA